MLVSRVAYDATSRILLIIIVEDAECGLKIKLESNLRERRLAIRTRPPQPSKSPVD
jgi:hypothetical protein